MESGCSESSRPSVGGEGVLGCVRDAGPAGDSDCRVQLLKSLLVTWTEIRKHRSVRTHRDETDAGWSAGWGRELT